MAWFDLARRLSLRSNGSLGGRMNRKLSRLACLLVGNAALSATWGAFATGCGGGESYPDATLNPGARSDQKGDTAAPDGSSDVTTPPAPGPGDKRLVSGSVELIGSGADSCTNQVPPSGDRWCGFARASAILGA